jgi:glycosyltransferase involved in cell wall biosynthesis
MTHVDCKLLIVGDGNFMDEARQLAIINKLETRVIFKGKIPPRELQDITRKAWIGVTLFENNGLSNYLSLANRFSDYIHAGIPQLCVNYRVYSELNSEYNVALLIDDLSPEKIAANLNRLLKDDALYATLQGNCLKARVELNWQAEEKTLSSFYKTIFDRRG